MNRQFAIGHHRLIGDSFDHHKSLSAAATILDHLSRFFIAANYRIMNIYIKTPPWGIDFAVKDVHQLIDRSIMHCTMFILKLNQNDMECFRKHAYYFLEKIDSLPYKFGLQLVFVECSMPMLVLALARRVFVCA